MNNDQLHSTYCQTTKLLSFSEMWAFLCHYKLNITTNDDGIFLEHTAKVYERPSNISDLMALLPKDKDFWFKPEPIPDGLQESLGDPSDEFFLYELWDYIEKCIIITVSDDLPDIFLLLNNGTKCRVQYNIA